MPRARFEPAISMFERPKTVLALHRAAIETGYKVPHYVIFAYLRNYYFSINVFTKFKKSILAKGRGHQAKK
jgi:hypothetical protein